jgi:hypothetical protein
MTTALTDWHPVRVREATSSDRDGLGQFGSCLVSLHHELDPQRFIDTTPTDPKGYGIF